MRKLILCFWLVAATLCLTAQTLPKDPAIRTGKLKNGMTYYLRHNAKEKGLADFYIAQRVGSILEEPRQRGLAHFLEHMAFNGTKHFPGKGKQLGIVPWCETVGVKFGANLNAYTSVDQTVYNISSVPLKREGIIDSCLLILNDWSHFLLLEDQEIDKERGVIHEEWRTRRAGKAVSRLMENATPFIYKGSKYEDCMPIGSMDIVDHFPYKDLRDYYHKWYRPDLQGIVVVGDIDVDKVEKKIKKLFSKIPMPKNAAERIYYPVPDNDTMMVNIQKDKEQPVVLVHLYMKRDATPDAEKNRESYVRAGYIDGLISAMVNSRLADVRQQANPPFMSASGRGGTFFISRVKEAFSMSVSCKQENILGGLMTAIAVTERARQHGFTQTELDRVKKTYLAGAERGYEGRNDRRNSHYVNQCIQNFLANEPLMSSEQRYELMKKLDREVTLDEVNQAVDKLISDKNQVVVVYAPDKADVVLPTEDQIRQVILTMQQQQFPPYEEEQLADQLLSQLPKAGSIVSEKPYKHGFVEMTLSNGMKVYVKKTDFVADGVQIKIHGEGGLSLYGDEDIPNFPFVSSAVTEAGIGQFDAATLRKMLTGKSIRYGVSVGQRGQSYAATGSVKSLQTMLELAYLHFTQPRRDTEAFEGLMNRTRSFLANRNASPKVDYNDSIAAIVYGHHPRVQPMTIEKLNKANYDRILQLYRERFADASNFKAVIVGNVDMDALRQMLCQYLASLPAIHKNEQTNWKNIAMIVPGESVHVFKKKMATPLANVTILYSANVPFTPQSDLELDFLKRVLQVCYTDSVREEKGGTYGVGVSFDLDKDDDPNGSLKISYNADPNRYEELNPIIYQQLKNIADHGPAESTMQKIKQFLVKQYKQVVITNDYWDYVIWHELDDDTDFDTDYCKLVENMKGSDVQRMAQKLLNGKRCIEVTMLSED